MLNESPLGYLGLKYLVCMYVDTFSARLVFETHERFGSHQPKDLYLARWQLQSGTLSGLCCLGGGAVSLNLCVDSGALSVSVNYLLQVDRNGSEVSGSGR